MVVNWPFKEVCILSWFQFDLKLLIGGPHRVPASKVDLLHVQLVVLAIVACTNPLQEPSLSIRVS